MPLLLAVVLAEMSEGGLDVKAIAMLGVLSAVGAALRPLGRGTAGLETVFFLLVLGGRVFGAGLRLRARRDDPLRLRPHHRRRRPVAALPDARGRLGRPRRGTAPAAAGRGEIALLAAYGAVSGLLYGVALNLMFWPFTTGLDGGLSFVAGAPVVENLHRFLVFSFATSLGLGHRPGLTNIVLVSLTGSVVLRTLRRAARKAAFEAPVEFTAPVSPGTPPPERDRPLAQSRPWVPSKSTARPPG